MPKFPNGGAPTITLPPTPANPVPTPQDLIDQATALASSAVTSIRSDERTAEKTVSAALAQASTDLANAAAIAIAGLKQTAEAAEQDLTSILNLFAGIAGDVGKHLTLGTVNDVPFLVPSDVIVLTSQQIAAQSGQIVITVHGPDVADAFRAFAGDTHDAVKAAAAKRLGNTSAYGVVGADDAAAAGTVPEAVLIILAIAATILAIGLAILVVCIGIALIIAILEGYEIVSVKVDDANIVDPSVTFTLHKS